METDRYSLRHEFESYSGEKCVSECYNSRYVLWLEDKVDFMRLGERAAVGTQPPQATNSQSDAIALWKEASDAVFADRFDAWYIANINRIHAVIAQRHT